VLQLTPHLDVCGTLSTVMMIMMLVIAISHTPMVLQLTPHLDGSTVIKTVITTMMIHYSYNDDDG
jgi:hypothetical protein